MQQPSSIDSTMICNSLFLSSTRRQGNGGMSDDEYRTHFSLWSLAKAPLIIGCDVTNMSSSTYDILTNAEVIAINQDRAGVQGTKVADDNKGGQVWSGPLADGSFAVVIVNRNALGSGSINVGFAYADIGGSSTQTYSVRDLWSHAVVGISSGQFGPVPLQPHQSRMFKVQSASKKKIVLTEQ